jgi:hypothetical protein
VVPSHRNISSEIGEVDIALEHVEHDGKDLAGDRHGGLVRARAGLEAVKRDDGRRKDIVNTGDANGRLAASFAASIPARSRLTDV